MEKVNARSKDLAKNVAIDVMIVVAGLIVGWSCYVRWLPTQGWVIEGLMKEVATMRGMASVLAALALVLYETKTKKDRLIQAVMIGTVIGTAVNAAMWIASAVKIYGSHWFTFHWFL